MKKLVFAGAILLGALIVASGLLAFYCSKERATMLLERRGTPLTVEAVTSAVRAFDRKTLVLLARAEVPLEEADKTGATPLITAIRSGNNHAIKFLLRRAKAVESVEMVDARGLTAVSHALIREDWGTARELAAYGASVDVELSDGSPAIVEAVAAQHEQMIEFLLGHGAETEVRDASGQAPLIQALMLRDAGLLERLLRAGADAKVTDREGNPAVLVAARQGDLKAVELLASYGANLDPELKDKPSPLAVAVSRNDTAMVRYLLESGVTPDEEDDRYSPLVLTAVRHGNFELVEALVEGDAPLGAEDALGETALKSSARQGDEEMFLMLLGAGAPYKEILWPVIESASPRLLEEVMSREVDLELKNEEGETVLAHMVRTGNFDLAERLLVKGADVSARCRSDQTVLHWALAHRKAEFVRMLIEAGAEPNERLVSPVPAEFKELFPEKRMAYYLRNDSGLTPLMLATGTSQMDVVKDLLANGAKTTLYSYRERAYPINFACALGNTDLTQIILGQEAGARSRTIVLDLSEQRARIYKDGKVYYSSNVSSGKSGYRTPVGEYVITNKYRHWTSTLYDSPMPYFMRLSCGAFGFHEGYVPRYPASHGCIRLPSSAARKFYAIMEVGDVVTIKR